MLNKYERWYYTLMAVARNRMLREYSEKHHIIPRSMGGTNNAVNTVKLTLREHFIAHWLLTKFTFGEDRRKMQLALFMMCRPGLEARVISAWQYEVARKANREALRGKKMSKKWCEKQKQRNLGNTFAKGHQNAKGFKHTEEFKKKLSERMKGTKGIKRGPYKKKRAPPSSETRAKMSRDKKGVKASEAAKLGMRLSHKSLI